MQCRHCLTDFHASGNYTNIDFYDQPKSWDGKNLRFYALAYACSKCSGAQIDVFSQLSQLDSSPKQVSTYPNGGIFPPPPKEVPDVIAKDYSEANAVLNISPKASAALSRRCLQAILSDAGYKSKNLSQQIDEALNEISASKILPLAIRENFDAIRNFGNFSAHPLTDNSTSQIIDVDAGEAEWCLEILNQLFHHFYVAPAAAAAKRAALSAKLAAAGKPPMKGS